MKEYVLVVDDEQSLRQVLALFFQKEGFEVDAASSLAEAEKAIDANPTLRQFKRQLLIDITSELRPCWPSIWER